MAIGSGNGIWRTATLLLATGAVSTFVGWQVGLSQNREGMIALNRADSSMVDMHKSLQSQIDAIKIIEANTSIALAAIQVTVLRNTDLLLKLDDKVRGR
jgi:hypothetical protein